MIKTFKREKIRDQLPKIGMESLFLGQFRRVYVQLLFVEKIKKPIFRARFLKKFHLKIFICSFRFRGTLLQSSEMDRFEVYGLL